MSAIISTQYCSPYLLLFCRYVYNCHTPELNPSYTSDQLKFLMMAELRAYNLTESSCHSLEQQKLQLFTKIVGWASILWLALLALLVIFAYVTVGLAHCWGGSSKTNSSR